MEVAVGKHLKNWEEPKRSKSIFRYFGLATVVAKRHYGYYYECFTHEIT